MAAGRGCSSGLCHHDADPGEHGFAHSRDHTKLARAGLAYAHGVMVCGAIVVAVMLALARFAHGKAA